MRKRNSLVFSMVEAEEEYCEQLEVLVSCFLRPFKMAASSKRPPLTHEDVNSIFLNSETVLFLHQIFLKGLTSRLESWPTLVLGNLILCIRIHAHRHLSMFYSSTHTIIAFIYIFHCRYILMVLMVPLFLCVLCIFCVGFLSPSAGDLFDMLLPMLSIYQEYVRNHHYSLQVLTECKSRAEFSIVLRRLETKPACKGRSLEVREKYKLQINWLLKLINQFFSAFFILF